MYSDISYFNSLAFKVSANCLAVSVLPVPVGSYKQMETNSLLASRMPALLTGILSTSVSTATFCPNTFVLILLSKFSKLSVFESSITSILILAILATSFWKSLYV